MHNQTSLRRLGRNHFNLSILECGAKRAAKMKTKKLLSEDFFFFNPSAGESPCSGKIRNNTILHAPHVRKTWEALL